MDKHTSNHMREISTWITPEQAAAEQARKKSEPKRIWGMVLLSGIISLVLAAAVGSIEAFFLFWFVLGMLLTSLACDEKYGPRT